MTDVTADGTDFGLSARLTFLMGGESARNFANRVGLKDSTLRSVLKGTRPSIDIVVAISDATGASLEWLATGRGRPYSKGTAPQTVGFDRQLYDLIAQCVERVFAEAGLELAPGVYAATIIDCYDEVRDIAPEGDMDEYNSLVPWIEYGLRKQAGHYIKSPQGV